MMIETGNQESFLVRLWTEATDGQGDAVWRGSIQLSPSGERYYFTSLDVPMEVLEESVHRLARSAKRARRGGNASARRNGKAANSREGARADDEH
jgi:hypothetical protein